MEAGLSEHQAQKICIKALKLVLYGAVSSTETIKV